MKKTIGKRLLSGVTALLLAASTTPVNLMGMQVTADDGDETVYPYSNTTGKTQNPYGETDKATLLAGDGILFETEPMTYKGSTVAETIQNYDKHYALGIASQFCVFLNSNFHVTNSDSEGRVAVGGNINIDTDNAWTGGGYVIGKGDYVSQEPLDTVLGKIESPGYAHIIMGGQLENGSIHAEAYGNAPTTRKLVINDDESNASSHLNSYIPETDTKKVDQTQVYFTKLFDFNEEFAKLANKSNEFASKKPTGECYLDNDTGHFVFNYTGDENEAEYVYFTIKDQATWDAYKDATYLDFTNIPNLPKAIYGDNGRALMDYDRSTKKSTVSYWENSFIIINVDIPNQTSYEIAAKDKCSTINTKPISRQTPQDTDTSWNNHIGTSSILYNFPAATSIKLGTNFQGTIFAPGAAVDDHDPNGNQSNMRGHLSGSLIAQSFSGSTEFGYRPFAAMNIPDTTYAIEYSKVDPEHKLVAGATLKLEKLEQVTAKENDDDIKIGDNWYKRTVVNDNIESSDEKVYLEDSLEPGYYILSETDAPKGYTKTDKEIYFEISNSGTVVSTSTTDEYYEKPVIYTVVDEDPDPINDHTIDRATADKEESAGGEYIAVRPKSNPLPTYTWNSWYHPFFVNINRNIEVSTITFYYKGDSTPYSTTLTYNSSDVRSGQNMIVTPLTGGGYSKLWDDGDYDSGGQFIQGSDNKSSPSGSKNYGNITKPYVTNRDVEKVTLTLRLYNANSTEREDITAGFMFGDPYGEYTTLLKNVSDQFKEYTILGEDDPDEYYKLEAGSPCIRNDREVEYSYRELKENLLAINASGTITVYPDATFNKEAEETKTYTAVSPLDVENCVYDLDGVKYTFDEDHMPYKDGVKTTLEAENLTFKPVDGGRLVIATVNGKEVVLSPMPILTREVSDNGLELENRKNVTINKTDIGGTVIENAQFKLTSDKELDLYEVIDDEGNTKKITGKEVDGKWVYEFTAGTTELSGLEDGTYTLEETVAPDGFEKVTTFEFTIKDGKVTSVTVDGMTSGNAEINSKNANQIDITDDFDPDELEITKLWDDNSNKYLIRPETLKVTITGTAKDAEGEEIAEATKTYEIVLSGDDDEWSKTLYLVNNQSDWSDYEGKLDNYSDYLPMYYYDNDTAYEYDYTYSEEDVSYYVPDNAQKDYTFKNVFDFETGSVVVNKTWNDKGAAADHPDVTFTLTSDDNAINIEKTLKSGEKAVTFTDLPVYVYTNDNGTVTRKAISYTLTEGAVEGYETVDSVVFTLENDADYTHTVDITNNLIVKKSVNIDKRDIANDKEVKGAELTITDESGNVIDSWKSGYDAEGNELDSTVHTVEGLIPGKEYTLHEVNAPEGYDEISSDIVFTVDEDGNVTIVTEKSNEDDYELSADKKTIIVNDTAKSDDNNSDSDSDSDSDNDSDSGNDSAADNNDSNSGESNSSDTESSSSSDTDSDSDANSSSEADSSSDTDTNTATDSASDDNSSNTDSSSSNADSSSSSSSSSTANNNSSNTANANANKTAAASAASTSTDNPDTGSSAGNIFLLCALVAVTGIVTKKKK